VPDGAPATPAGDAAQPAPPAPRGPGGLDTDALRRSWPDVLAKLFEMRRSTWTFVSQNAQVADYDGQRVLLTISTVGLADTFRRGPHAEYVRQALIDVLGVDARVEGRPADEPYTAPADPPAAPHPAVSPAAAPIEPVAGRPAAQAAPAAPAAPVAPVGDAPSWSEAPPPPETAPEWASPLERARAAVTEEEQESSTAQHVVDDTAVSEDDESIDELADVGVPVIERILGGTVISEEER
jgi:DNA polymerase-3 subunit gamma/tau